MPKHQVRFRVRYAETDQMGVVYHANYLVWMEIGRVEAMREHGFHYKELEREAGIALAVAEAQCRYIYPARYDDEVMVETELRRSSARFMEFGYEIRLPGPGSLLATGTTKHVWVGKDMRPARLPESYHGLLALSSALS
jgi:acyl-CoA thioester hydrolase